MRKTAPPLPIPAYPQGYPALSPALSNQSYLNSVYPSHFLVLPLPLTAFKRFQDLALILKHPTDTHYWVLLPVDFVKGPDSWEKDGAMPLPSSLASHNLRLSGKCSVVGIHDCVTMANCSNIVVATTFPIKVIWRSLNFQSHGSNVSISLFELAFFSNCWPMMHHFVQL